MTNRFNIVLIQPPVWGIYDPPTALAQLSSCLKVSNFKVAVFDLNIEFYKIRPSNYDSVWAIEQSSFWTNAGNVDRYFSDNAEAVDYWITRILDTNPDLVGFSTNVCSLYSAKLLADKIKKIRSQVKIALGGPMFFVPAEIEKIFDGNCIDAIVYGEGEETFKELALLESKKEGLRNCKGISYRDTDGKIINNDRRTTNTDLNALPFLDLKAFPLEKYETLGHLGKHISLMTSRGCVQQCAFCGPKAYWQGYRTMSGERIYAEICYHISNFPDTERVEFLDLLLNGNMNVLRKFCELMASKPPKQGLKWHANLIIRPEMDSELMAQMKKAGCDHVTFGIETGSQYILDNMKKRYKIKDADAVLKAAHGAGITVTCNFMFGFPGETEEYFNETLEFLRRNAAHIDTAYPSRTYFTIEPYSYAAGHLDEFGIIPNSSHGQYWISKDGKNDFPERMKRCETFTKLAVSLGVSVGSGLQTTIEQDRWMNLGNYYESNHKYDMAIECFVNYLKYDPDNTVVNAKLRQLGQAVKS